MACPTPLDVEITNVRRFLRRHGTPRALIDMLDACDETVHPRIVTMLRGCLTESFGETLIREHYTYKEPLS